MGGEVQKFNKMLGDLFPGFTDIVAEVCDRSVTVKVLNDFIQSGLALCLFFPLGKTNKKMDKLLMEGATMAFLDGKGSNAYRVGLPLRIMVARFPGRPLHNFIRINYGGVPSPEDRNKGVVTANGQGEINFSLKVLEGPGWCLLYPLGSLLSDQRLENQVRDLAVNGRDSTMFREFLAIDERNIINSQNFDIVDYTPDDAKLWELWVGNMDTNIFQTNLRPKNFITAKGRSEDYYLKLISYGSKKIGAVWVEKITQRTATGELGLLIGEPHLWGLGIGGRAINAMIDTAKNDLGLKFLWASVRESNQRAVNCYKRGGFSIVRKVPVYKPDGSYQMWVTMEKMI
ncbi:MAG: GNAT family N-acetyltransferase [Desulfocucumaceae bacterium]